MKISETWEQIKSFTRKFAVYKCFCFCSNLSFTIKKKRMGTSEQMETFCSQREEQSKPWKASWKYVSGQDEWSSLSFWRRLVAVLVDGHLILKLNFSSSPVLSTSLIEACSISYPLMLTSSSPASPVIQRFSTMLMLIIQRVEKEEDLKFSNGSFCFSLLQILPSCYLRFLSLQPSTQR